MLEQQFSGIIDVLEKTILTKLRQETSNLIIKVNIIMLRNYKQCSCHVIIVLRLLFTPAVRTLDRNDKIHVSGYIPVLK